MKYLYMFLVLLAFSGIFILVYYLNGKTKKPDNCQELPEECINCKAIFCSNKRNKKEKEN